MIWFSWFPRSQVRVRVITTAIRRGFELYECLLVSFIYMIKYMYSHVIKKSQGKGGDHPKQTPFATIVFNPSWLREGYVAYRLLVVQRTWWFRASCFLTHANGSRFESRSTAIITVSLSLSLCDSVRLSVCLSVRTIKPKRLKVKSLNLAQG